MLSSLGFSEQGPNPPWACFALCALEIKSAPTPLTLRVSQGLRPHHPSFPALHSIAGSVVPLGGHCPVGSDDSPAVAWQSSPARHPGAHNEMYGLPCMSGTAGEPRALGPRCSGPGAERGCPPAKGSRTLVGGWCGPSTVSSSSAKSRCCPPIYIVTIRTGAKFLLVEVQCLTDKGETALGAEICPPPPAPSSSDFPGDCAHFLLCTHRTEAADV